MPSLFNLGFLSDLSIEDVNPKVIENIPIKWCMANNFLPIKQVEEKILIAFADPFSKTDIQGARKLFGNNMIIGIAAPNMIEKKLEKLGSGSLYFCYGIW